MLRYLYLYCLIDSITELLFILFPFLSVDRVAVTALGVAVAAIASHEDSNEKSHKQKHTEG